jgi:hypothetical protein
MGEYLLFIVFLLFADFAIADCGTGSRLKIIAGSGGSMVTLSDWNCNVDAWGGVKYQGNGKEFSMYSTKNPESSRAGRIFISPVPEGLSQDKNYLKIQRVVRGELYLEDGSKKETENSYCDTISMSAGCVIKSSPASSCSGHWVAGRWKLFSTGGGDEEGLSLVTPPPKGILESISKVSGKEGKASAILDNMYMGVDSYMACYPPGQKNLADFNDIAFYLAEGGDNYNSLKIYGVLEKIAPSRIVLKLNMADALWASGEKQKARSYYRGYASAMVRAGLRGKIPSRVELRSN